MAITIKRNTGWIGSISKIKIKLNGEKVASVVNNQQIEVELPDNKAFIKAVQQGVKSNEIEVQNGDILEIKTTLWNKASLPLIIVLLSLSNLIFDSTHQIIADIFIAIFSIVSILLIDGFHLEILDREQ